MGVCSDFGPSIFRDGRVVNLSARGGDSAENVYSFSSIVFSCCAYPIVPRFLYQHHLVNWRGV